MRTSADALAARARRPWVALAAALLLWGLTPARPAAAQDPPARTQRERILALLMDGHEAFGDGRYDDARRLYEEARQAGSSSGWLPELQQILERRAALGQVRAEAVHRVGVIFVTERRLLGAAGVQLVADVTLRQRRAVLCYLRLARQVFEAFSGGHWSLDFEVVDAASTLPDGLDVHPASPDLLGLEPFFFAQTAALDTYVTVSNTVSPARGLARTFPYVAGVLYGPHRGMLNIHPEHHGYGIIIHELFHVLEWVAGGVGGPAHGYLPDRRQAFPGWRGATELDYYRWHFATTLADRGWQRLQHTDRWRLLGGGSAEALAAIQAAYVSVPLAQRYRAAALVDEAAAARDHPERARALYEQALTLSPYEPRALRPLLLSCRGSQPARAARLRERLRLARAAAEPYELPADAGALGEAVGAWHPEDIELGGADVEWDVTRWVRGPGRYEVTLRFTEGWQAIACDRVSLLAGGRLLARDEHPGRSGRESEGDTYRLATRAPPAGARVLLRARLRGLGGVDSNGVVHLRGP